MSFILDNSVPLGRLSKKANFAKGKITPTILRIQFI